MAKKAARSMASPTKGKNPPQSTTRKTKTGKRKPCCDGRLDTIMQGKVPKGKRKGVTVGALGTNCAADMPICPTGIACVFGRDAGQNLICIQAPVGGTKCLKADQNGFFLANC